MWGVQKNHNMTKEYTYRVRTLIWPFYFNLDLCAPVHKTSSNILSAKMLPLEKLKFIKRSFFTRKRYQSDNIYICCRLGFGAFYGMISEVYHGNKGKDKTIKTRDLLAAIKDFLRVESNIQMTLFGRSKFDIDKYLNKGKVSNNLVFPEIR